MGQPRMGHTLWVCVWVLSSRGGVLQGAWDLRKQKNHAVQLEGIVEKVGGRGGPKTLTPGSARGTQHQGRAEGST